MMKVLFALSAIVTTAVSISAMAACPQNGGEAQFSGRVLNPYMIQHDKVECVYQIEFTRFDVNPACPIDQVEAERTEFRDATCLLTNGEKISGYMIEKAGSAIVIERTH
jgi:hypothetical protein